MTDTERTKFADALLAVVFSMRPSDDEAGQAWTLNVTTTALARAILASVGPAGDVEAMLELSARETRRIVAEVQSQFFRDRLTAPNGAKRTM